MKQGQIEVARILGAAVALAADVPRFRLGDIRLLLVKFDAQGVRRREFHEAVGLMNDDPPMGGGLQLSGPCSVLKLLKDLRDKHIP